MTRHVFVLRAEWWKLAGYALFCCAFGAFWLVGGVRSAWPDAAATAIYGAIGVLSYVVAVRFTRSGIYIYEDRVTVRGVARTRELRRRDVVAVGVRDDSLASRRPVCVGVVTQQGEVLAPATLSGSRGSAEIKYMLYRLSTALGVPTAPGADDRRP